MGTDRETCRRTLGRRSGQSELSDKNGEEERCPGGGVAANGEGAEVEMGRVEEGKKGVDGSYVRDDNASPSSPPNPARHRRPSAAHAPSSSSSSTSPTASAPSKQPSSSATTANAQPARPPLRNNFDLEPNPFEQSFSVSSRTSLSSSSISSLKAAATGSNVPDSSDAASTVKGASPPSGKRSPSNGSAHSRRSSLAENGADTPKPILPPLASITSPSDPSYAWSFSSAGISNSLRSGPLSPAMLAGPQTQAPASSASQPPSSVAALAASAASVHPPLFGFDPSGTFRTGLTPSTGLTPLVGGPVAFPPPSPNTAAFLAMMNASGSGAGGATITPNTLSALTGVLQQSQNGGAGNASGVPSASVAPSQVSAPAYSVGAGSASRYAATTTAYPLSQSQNDNNVQYANASAAATNAAANGLFLLSQAHQELTKREEAQKQSQAQANGGSQNQNNPNANGNSYSAKRGSKRKNDSGSVSTQSSATSAGANKSAPKRTRTTSTANSGANTRSSARRSSTTASSNLDGDDDMNMDMDDGGDDSDDDDQDQQQSSKGNQSKKPETEEEKRRNFLERNRQAALKCRQRKKAWLSQLQAKVEYLQNENERLTNALVSSREEISRLSALVGSAGVGLPIPGVPVGSVSSLGVGSGHPHTVGQPGMAHHLQHPHSMPAPHHMNQHHVTSQHPVSVSVSLPPGASVAHARVQASPQMMSKAAPQGSAPQPHSPHSAASEGRSSRSSFRDYREGRDPREREMNGHAPQAVAVNGRGYGY